MALELECQIVRKLNVQNGTSARGPWCKQEFIVEYRDGNFPNTVCMNVWGEDKVNDLARFNVGDNVKISLNLSSREFNGRWYTDIRAWRIEAVTAAAQQPAAQQAPAQAPAYQASVPAGFAPGSAASQPVEAPVLAADDIVGSADDLPF